MPVPLPIDDELTEQLVRYGFPMRSYSEYQNVKSTPHALAGEVLLLHYQCPKSIAAVVGAHHGKPSGVEDENNAEEFYSGYHQNIYGNHPSQWEQIQQEFLQFALENAGFCDFSEIPELPQPAQVLYSGLLVMADWLASNSRYYPLLPFGEVPVRIDFENRHQTAWEQLNLPFGWRAEGAIPIENLCQSRFEFSPNLLQETTVEIAQQMNGGIMVMEAPMGIGKTEAALLAAELFMAQQGRTGVFFALPTQATSDGIFPRFEECMHHLDTEQHSLQLSHGKAQFNEQYMALDRLGENSTGTFSYEEFGPVVHTWFSGSKKSILADFVVGTIDQLLMTALSQKHLMLRHLGMANKVVIIDECHAYDAYMSRYLYRALHWLGAYRVPVVILSATLPVEKRKLLVTQYLDIPQKKANRMQEPWTTCEAYPLLTYTKGEAVYQRTINLQNADARLVEIQQADEQEFFKCFPVWREQGACIGIIVNTVKRAQEIYELLRVSFGDALLLLHAALLAPDRMKRERVIRGELGKSGKRPHFRIVIGTQVLEQSLDIDFDVLFTDLCPMDLLLQRIGRLHRHNRSRPEGMRKAVCYLMGVQELQSGTKAIYGEFLLERTKAFLTKQLCLPADIAPLVQRVYAVDEPLAAPPEGYERMKLDFLNHIQNQQQKSEDYRIPQVQKSETIHHWMKEPCGAEGEAQVRDSEPSVEVLVLQSAGNGVRIIGQEQVLGVAEMPDVALAKEIARQSIRLPSVLFRYGKLKSNIEWLEKQTLRYFQAWQESPWLKGELILALDENLQAKFSGYLLTYDRNKGLIYEKEDV